MDYRRGTICYAELDGCGSEQKGDRPCVIISNDKGNESSPTVIVALMTTKDKKGLPTHVKIDKNHGGLISESTVLLEQIRVIDKQRIGSFIGVLPPLDMFRIDEGIRVSLGL